jgi:hypothetical protein
LYTADRGPPILPVADRGRLGRRVRRDHGARMSSRADDATVEQFRGEAASPVVPAVRRSLDPQERMI